LKVNESKIEENFGFADPIGSEIFNTWYRGFFLPEGWHG
jgi:hypothetical protein